MTPEQALTALRALVHPYFDGVDASAYVAALRDEPDVDAVTPEVADALPRILDDFVICPTGGSRGACDCAPVAP